MNRAAVNVWASNTALGRQGEEATKAWGRRAS